MVLTITRTSSYAQFFTVLLLFLFVVALAYFSTRWMGKMQNGIKQGKNIQIIETMRLSNTKYIQIIRMGKKYVAIAVSKDTVTMLTELKEEEIEFSKEPDKLSTENFKEILKKLGNKDTDGRQQDYEGKKKE